MAGGVLDAWAARISYKPRWRLRAEEWGDEQIRITVVYTGADSTGPGERDIAHCRVISRPVHFEDFVRECIITFEELENHETREWFRADGRHWPEFVPHDPKAIMVPLRDTGAIYDGFQQSTVD